MRLILTWAFVIGLIGVAAAEPRPEDKTGTAKPDTAKGIDGTWTVVAAEKNGQPVADAASMTVSVKDSVVSVTGKDSKPSMTFKIEFQGPGMAKVTDANTAEKRDEKAEKAGGKAKQAVYVLTADMLAVCIHDDQPTRTGTADTKSPDTTGQPTSQSYCTLLLKRADKK